MCNQNSQKSKSCCSEFIDDLGSHVKTIEYTGDDNCDFILHDQIRLIPRGMIDDSFFDNFSISATDLNNFLERPSTFYFSKILQFSDVSSKELSFGNIMHKLLESIYVSDSNNKQNLTFKEVLFKEEALNEFSKIFDQKSHEINNEHIRNDYKLRGECLIENIYNDGNYINPGVIALEKSISGIKLSDVKKALDCFGLKTDLDFSGFENIEVKGTIDKIEITEDAIIFTDYKTGKYDAKKLKKPDEKNFKGGNYWRQAVFYYILFMASGLKNEYPSKDFVFTFIFLGDLKCGIKEEKLSIQLEDVQKVLEQLSECLNKIKNLDFDYSYSFYDLDESDKKWNEDYMFIQNEDYDNSLEIEKATIKEVISNFNSLSVSVLNRFLNCRYSFYYDNVLKLSKYYKLSFGDKEHKPKINTNHAPTGEVFGTIMHKTLEEIYDKKQFDKSEILKIFDSNLEKHKTEIVDGMNLDDIKKYGHNLIKNLYENYILNSCKCVDLEKEITVLLEGKYPITGKIDKIEYDGDTIRIIDYKTGYSEFGMEELEKGKDYWRQAVFYKLLLLNDLNIDTDNKIIEVKYIFLDNSINELGYSIHDVVIDDNDISSVIKDIKDFWDLIRSGRIEGAKDFGPDCGKPDCDFCRLSNIDK